MPRDTLWQVLRALRPRVVALSCLDDRWAAQMPPACEVVPDILPAAQYVFRFHAVIEGACRAVCGLLGLDARPFNPILASLPRVLHVSSAAPGAHSAVVALLQAAVVASDQRPPDEGAELEQAGLLLFVETLSVHMDVLPVGQTGWLAGLRDPVIGRALALLHEQPRAPWTLERLASDMGIWPAMLHERFVHFIGVPPTQYLSRWRVQLAASSRHDAETGSRRGDASTPRAAPASYPEAARAVDLNAVRARR